jgi:hypothetical protein
MTRPPRLFHCFPEKAKAIFQEWRLWFSALKDFNDPFEGMPSFQGVVREIVELELRKHYAFLPPTDTSSWPAFRRNMEAERASVTADCLRALQENFREKSSQRFRVFCFTAKKPDIAMWGHYADCHRGFVIEFEPSHLLFDDLNEVHYQEDRPEPEKPGDFRYLLIKNALWQNEHEYRLIKKLAELDESEPSDGKRFRFVPLPSEAVKAVFFGCQMLPEVREQMIRDLGTRKIQKFLMQPHTSKYALLEVPIDEWKPPAADFDSGIRQSLRM